jgi:hypothetical protein
MAMELLDLLRADLGQGDVEPTLDIVGVDHVHHNDPSAALPSL